MMTDLGKRQKKKENEEQNDDIEYTDIENISKNLKIKPQRIREDGMFAHSYLRKIEKSNLT